MGKWSKGPKNCYKAEIEGMDSTKVILRDLGALVPIYEAAKELCAELHNRFPGRRVFFYDVNGIFNEMQHEEGEFIKFGFRHEECD